MQNTLTKIKIKHKRKNAKGLFVSENNLGAAMQSGNNRRGCVGWVGPGDQLEDMR